MDERIDSRQAWVIGMASLAILAVAFGAPYIVIVALKSIAAEFGGERSIPSGANSLAWLGTGVGGLAMGLIADRIGVRWTVTFGALAMCAGLFISSFGGTWNLLLGHGILVGLLGAAGMNSPLYVYITRWFERRRGTALALIASGQYIAGAVWPPLFEHAIAAWGWRETMRGFGLVIICLIVPMALIFLQTPPQLPPPAPVPAGTAGKERALGLPRNVTFWLLAGASFLCCIPMALPQAHLIAFCGDLGFVAGRGALMLSVLLTCAFISRQFWGWLSDHIGGLMTLLACSVLQALAMLGFLLSRDEASLFLVSILFGLGFSGMIPAYVLAAREHFPASEAKWRMPMLLLTGMTGMATGSWAGGKLYDTFGFYAPAFATGLAANLANLLILVVLALLWHRSRTPATARVAA
ncbi:MAG: MFS transporter [Hyphomicrobiaceae bacterium]